MLTADRCAIFARMSYVPTLCEGCGRVSLVGMQAFSQTAPECQRCHHPLRVIPSRIYNASELELFRELSETVAESTAPNEAYRLATAVGEALWSGRFAETFDLLVVRWPLLVPLRVVVGSSRERQQHVLEMLKTIFEALAITRRSGIMPAVDAPPPADTGTGERS